jgi:serine/threonine protein kinase
MTSTALILSRYTISEEIGQGSFGKIIWAKDTKYSNREVAIKIVKPR